MDVILDLILCIRDALFSDNAVQARLSEASIVDQSYSKDPLQQSIDSASAMLLSILRPLLPIYLTNALRKAAVPLR